MFKYLLLLLICSIASAEMYVGKTTEGFLVISDKDRCVQIQPDANFSWMPVTQELMTLDAFKAEFGITDDLSDESLRLCKPAPIVMPRVAKNSIYLTRPMKNADFTRAPHRIEIGKPCEVEQIKPYSSRETLRGYHFATNKAGFRGLTICKKGDTDGIKG